MTYDVLVTLPHKWFTGKIEFEDIPELGEFVELTPRAKFKVIELNNETKNMTLRFEVIFHDSNIETVLQTEFDFQNMLYIRR